ncbi:MAG: hypothetical protein JXR84_21330 [Anaerolineae bacterium]|nr:hypothetical protein [Anaerolineae bacterium]
MNPQIKIEVIDKDGWRKEFSFQKGLFHIGSAGVNDLVLENARGGGVAARHAQLIAAADGTGYRLVNLGDTDILLNEAGDKLAPPHSVVSVKDGTIVKIGDFTLVFHGEAMMVAAAPSNGRSSHIGLQLSLPRTYLAPHQSLAGVLAVGNHGDQAGVQFDLDLEGLESDCYNIEPAPLLPSGSEREVALRIFHRGNTPLAGEHTITIHAVAPQAYPNEEATITCVIQVQPFYQHTLRPVSSDQQSTANAQPKVVPTMPRAPANRFEDLLPPTVPTRDVQSSPISQQPEKETIPPVIPENLQVLTLKAAPPPELQEAKPKEAPPTSSTAEDWWKDAETESASPVSIEAETIEISESTVPDSVPQEPDIAEVPAPLPVSGELEMVTDVEVAIEIPAPPIDVRDTAQETVASVEETKTPETPAEEPEVIHNVSSVIELQMASVEATAVAESPVDIKAPLEQKPAPPSDQQSAVNDQPKNTTPADDDWWSAPEISPQEKEEPQVPVLKIAPLVEVEPASPDEAEVKPISQADDWWSEPEKENTPPAANEEWWSA